MNRVKWLDKENQIVNNVWLREEPSLYLYHDETRNKINKSRIDGSRNLGRVKTHGSEKQEKI
jgi:hypothetical protein